MTASPETVAKPTRYELALLTGTAIKYHETPDDLYDALVEAFGEIEGQGSRWVSFAAGSTHLTFWRAG